MSEKKDKSRKGTSSVGRKSKLEDNVDDPLSQLLNNDIEF